jgi:phosphoenolpyruvate carboxykinase (GTP)
MTGERPIQNPQLIRWVEDSASLLKPDRVVWCDGSKAEFDRLMKEAVAAGTFIPLDQKKWPDCYFHHSNQNDVARVEHLTFICTPTKEEAGPTNNWMEPAEARHLLTGLFDGAMKGRTLYVVPYVMGPVASPFAKVGVELTDSIYVVLSMGIMTRMGKTALDRLGSSAEFNRGVHSVRDCDPSKRFSATSPGTTPSGRSAPATAATRSWARSAWPCASPATWPGTRAGWPNTCSSSRPSRPRARSGTWRRPSRRPAGRPTSP